MEKLVVRKLIRECIDEMVCEGHDFVMDEMAYPASFNFEEFKNIKSFAGKQKYAKERLLRKVGAGSSRAVFKIDDEKVLKVALNNKGLAQNLAESEGYKQNYDALARVFDIDEDDMWIEMELAKRITSEKRFKQLTDTTPNELVQWLMYRSSNKWAKPIVNLDDNEFYQDMQDFVFDYQYPVPGDFNRLATYGEVLRDGKPKVVVIDFGYDQNTHDIYRDARKKKYASVWEKM